MAQGKRIIFFTKYTESGPSSRYRSFQYIEFLQHYGFEVAVKPLFNHSYTQKLFKQNKKSLRLIIFCYLRRFLHLLFLKKGSVIFIEYELFPFIPFFLEKIFWKKQMYTIVDYDDAVFHNYDQSTNYLIKRLLTNKIPHVIKQASHVITGSQYLYEFAKQYNPCITEIPTSINLQKYGCGKQQRERFTIGWIGTPKNSIHLLKILPAIKKFVSDYDARLLLIGFDRLMESKLQGINYRLVEWKEEDEVFYMQQFSVGIMPLIETPFTRGKCGFKLIQYMGCCLPTISTPLQSNININRTGKNLFATKEKEWYDAFVQIYQNRDDFANAGKENFEVVKQYYSVQANHKKIIKIIKEQMANGSCVE